MTEQIMGTCSICGGAVTIPTAHYSTKPPKPTCQGCGATPKSAHGPKIEMQEQDPVKGSGKRLLEG